LYLTYADLISLYSLYLDMTSLYSIYPDLIRCTPAEVDSIPTKFGYICSDVVNGASDFSSLLDLVGF
jgi:hypothetical protein